MNVLNPDSTRISTVFVVVAKFKYHYYVYISIFTLNTQCDTYLCPYTLNGDGGYKIC